jgi:hypothetical protein
MRSASTTCPCLGADGPAAAWRLTVSRLRFRTVWPGSTWIASAPGVVPARQRVTLGIDHAGEVGRRHDAQQLGLLVPLRRAARGYRCRPARCPFGAAGSSCDVRPSQAPQCCSITGKRGISPELAADRARRAIEPPGGLADTVPPAFCRAMRYRSSWVSWWYGMGRLSPSVGSRDLQPSHTSHTHGRVELGFTHQAQSHPPGLTIHFHRRQVPVPRSRPRVEGSGDPVTFLLRPAHAVGPRPLFAHL